MSDYMNIDFTYGTDIETAPHIRFILIVYCRLLIPNFTEIWLIVHDIHETCLLLPYVT
jgi:hypothetical protein